ncbi:RDD family protein [Ruegeria lacuscaerulensis]|uniref:RDD family protein n=1 Tax=Ruegeria lacuscaerulensis TaxID=55218 RepID=UPI0014809958|nr:RDD family protein [Ruegeria lacuscaerulensis]
MNGNNGASSQPEALVSYAGFGVRFAAMLIDAVIISLITIPLSLSIYGNHYFDNPDIIVGPADFLINWVAPAFAVVVFWVTLSATPGKIVLKLKVVDAETGEKPSLGQAIGRYLAYFLSFIPLCAGYFWVLLDPRNQGWHDKLAKTVVVVERKPAEPVHFSQKA